MRLLIGLYIALVLVSCKEMEEPDPIPTSATAVLISNEGNFGWGEGTLTVYDPAAKESSNEVYYRVNAERMGNVFQSMIEFENKFYFVLNNSAKIVVTDSTFKKIGEIKGFNSPRNIVQTQSSKAYVTDLYANKLWIIDLISFQILSSIHIHGWLENGLVVDNVLYLGSMESEKVYMVNTTSDQLVDSITFHYANQSLQLDKDRCLWVLSQGNGTDKPGYISRYSLNGDSMVFEVEIGDNASQLCYDNLKERLLFIQEGVREINANSKLSEALIQANNRNIYALKVNPTTGDIYLSDVQDFISQSTIYRYNADAVEIDKFKAGILSGNFLFVNE